MRSAKFVRGLGTWDPFAFATLTARILVVNVIALCVLVGGVLLLEQYRQGLIDVRVVGLQAQAQMMANAISRAALDADGVELKREAVTEILQQFRETSGVRMQVYDEYGRMIADTRQIINDLSIGEPIDQRSLGRDLQDDGFLDRMDDILRRLISLFGEERHVYREAGAFTISREPAIYSALNGFTVDVKSVNSSDELIITVATPIRRVKRVRGVVAISTAGGDIDAVVEVERRTFLEAFAVAALVVLLTSTALASQIALPIRRLANAADAATSQLSSASPRIPDMSERGDEIGNLSVSLRRMTAALYARIEAIESFASDVAHEIKNPLSSMRSAVESLRLTKNEDHRDQLFAVIEHDVRRMDRLVTDIANASRLDAALVREEWASFDLRGLLETIIAIAQGQAGAHKVTIALDTPPDAPNAVNMTLRGLESRLAQVFHNLLDNAISFSPVGGRIVVAATDTTIDGKRAIAVNVSDEGEGIPPENLESIFERFYSQRPESEAFGQHSGLGLNISRQIVEAHGGDIRAENRRSGPGACFVVRLPK